MGAVGRAPKLLVGKLVITFEGDAVDDGIFHHPYHQSVPLAGQANLANDARALPP